MRPAGPKVEDEGQGEGGSMGKCCKLPSGVWVGAPEAKYFCSILTPMAIWNMRWSAPDQAVDQRGRGERLW